MVKSKLSALLICASVLAVSGCQALVNKGAGFEKLHPAPATRTFILLNDVKFAKEVVAHNEMCDRSPECRKN